VVVEVAAVNPVEMPQVVLVVAVQGLAQMVLRLLLEQSIPEVVEVAATILAVEGMVRLAALA
jgi:hypothetical protein